MTDRAPLSEAPARPTGASAGAPAVGPRSWSTIGVAVALGAGLLLLAEVFGEWETESAAQVAAWLVLGACACGSMAFLTRAPVGSFVVNSVGVLGLVFVGDTSDVYQFTNLVALYAMTSAVTATGGGVFSRPPAGEPWWRSGWVSVVGLAVGLVGVASYFNRFPEDSRGSVFVFTVALLWVAGWLMGWVNGSGRARQQLAAERDLSLELAETRRARLELEASRSDMARELHDILGHTLSVMMVHAGAARGALATDPDAAATSLATIESTGRAAMEDLDRVLGLLKSSASGDSALDASAEERAPTPGLAELPALVAGVAGGGAMEVSLTVAPEVEAALLGRPRQLAVYRVAQEALTNVLKHADASRVEVEVLVREGVLTLVVADDGRGVGPTAGGVREHGASSGGGGQGLPGMRERATVFGGDVTIEDRSARPGAGGSAARSGVARSGVVVTATFGEVRP